MKWLGDKNIEFMEIGTFQIPKNVTNNMKDRYNKYKNCKNSINNSNSNHR